MRHNTPPRREYIEDGLDDINDVEDDGIQPDDEDNWVVPGDELIQYDEGDGDSDELEEITIEDLESRLQSEEPQAESEDDSYELSPSSPISPEMDDAILTFRQHSAPVFACAMHPHNYLCATGGEDDKVFVWNRHNGQIIKEISDHKDTVTDVHFNYDGKYLATGDMAGNIFLYKITESSDDCFSLSKVWEYIMGDMTWLLWHKSTNVLFAGTEDGEIYIFRLPSGSCKILPGQGVRCESGALANDGKKLYAAYSSGNVKLWDIKSTTVVMEVDERHTMVHQEGSCTVACDLQSPMYLSGDESGKLLFCTTHGPTGSVQANGAIECLAFSPSNNYRMVACGTLDGQVTIWDIVKQSLRAECEKGDQGVTKIQWISDFTIMVSTLKGNIIAYDARSGHMKYILTGHTADIYSFCYDPKENIILTVSEDKLAKIFKLPEMGD